MPEKNRNVADLTTDRTKTLTFLTTGTFRGEEMVVVVDAINFIVNIDREGHSVEAFVAHATAEAAWVIRFAHCVQDLLIESKLACL